MPKIGTSTIKQRAQLGFESDSAPGVAVPATHKLRSGKLTISANSERKEIVAAGDEYPSATVELDRWAEGSVADATPDAREQNIWARLLFGRPVITADTEAGYFERIFSTSDNRPTCSVEFGDAQFGSVATGVFATGGALEFSLNGKISSYELTLRGAHWQDNVPLTAEDSLTQLQLIPFSGLHAHVYIADSLGGVRGGTAQETKGIVSVKVNLGERTGQVKFQDGGVDLVALLAQATIDLTMRRSSGVALIDELRAGAVKYLRLFVGVGKRTLEFLAPVGLAAEGTREDESGGYYVKTSLRIQAAADLQPTIRTVSDLAPYAGEAFEGATSGQLTSEAPEPDSDGDGIPDTSDPTPNG